MKDEESQKRMNERKKNQYNTVIAVSQELYAEIKKNGNVLYVADETKYVCEFVKVKQCKTCCSLDHSAKKCRSQPVCPHCAGNHILDLCTKKKEPPKCINCTRVTGGQNPTVKPHRANGNGCPKILAAKRRLIDGR